MTRLNVGYSRAFLLIPVGAARSEEKIREDVQKALDEAIADFADRRIKPTVEPEGGFLGAGVDWSWWFHLFTVAGIIIGRSALEKAGGELFELFFEKLRKHNLIPKPLQRGRDKVKTPRRKPRRFD